MSRRMVASLLLLFLVASGAVSGEPSSDLVARALEAYRSRQFDASLAFFQEAIAAGANDSSTFYNAACAAALASRSETALDLLARAVAAGYTNVDHIRRDPDLQSLAGSPRFSEITASAEKQKSARERFWNSPSITSPYSETLSEDERIAGLSRIWSEAKFNFVYFDRLPNLDWDALYLSYLPRVRSARSTVDYYKLLMSFMAQLNDGHTTVAPPRETWPMMLALPPLRISLVEERYLIEEVTDPSIEGVAPGMEIVAIDGVPVNQYAAERITPYQSASTPQDRADRTAHSLLWGAEGTTVTLTLRNGKGKELQRMVRRMTAAEQQKFARRTAPFEYRRLPGDVAYVALNDFSNSKAAEEFEARFDEIAKAGALIIDVRRNGGGNSMNGYRVLAALTDKPFRTSKWSTRMYKAVFRAWGRPDETFGEEADEIRPSGTRHFRGPVVVLTSASTYSAAEDFTVAFDTMKRGTIIGEPTGGSTGQPVTFRLPGGGAGYVCAKRDTYADGKEFVGVGIQPQIIVHPTVRDVRAGKDTVLDAAVKFLSAKGSLRDARSGEPR